LGYRLDRGVAVVKVTDEVDVSTSSSLRNSLLRVITDENHHGLVVNLASVSFLDSTGVGVLVGIWHRVCATRGCLTLAAPSRQARECGHLIWPRLGCFSSRIVAPPGW
jgi:anti-sigma B factor antagonist